MKPEEYKKLIEDKHQEIKGTNLILNPVQFKYFVDIAICQKSGEEVLNNWGLYLTEDHNHSPKDFFEWYLDLLL